MYYPKRPQLPVQTRLDLAMNRLLEIFVKVQKAWNDKTADCLRTYLPGVSAV